MTQEATHLCHNCVKDKFLKAEVKNSGTKVECMRCGKMRQAMEFTALARRIDDAVQEHFEPSHEDFGPNWGEVAAEQAGIDTDVAEQMRQWMSNTRGFEARKDGDYDDYNTSTVFEERRLDRGPYRRRWQEFKVSVKQEARFFNRQGETYLSDIFTGIELQANWQGEAVIVSWDPDPARPLVRGRVAQSDEDLTTFLSNPAQELGPPPQGTASAGRMNALGVSAFYGALDVATCRAEVRPPVGSHVVFARFEIVRPLRILDMDALARIAVHGSIFDDDYPVRLARAAFLRNFGNEIAQPVMPRDEAFGYLPTQVVADYIGQRLGLDGILFRSVQAGRRKNEDGSFPQNVVLFNHAARVDKVDISNLKFDVDLGWFDEDEEDGDDSISVSSEEQRKKRTRLPKEPSPALWDAESKISDDDRQITLRYVADSVTVERVRGVEYDEDERIVSFSYASLKEQRERRRRFAQWAGGARRGFDASPDLDPEIPF